MEAQAGTHADLQGYAEAGGVKKAITQTAESVYDKLTPAEQTIARGIFLRLTELGEGVQDTRRRVKMDELAQATEQEAVKKVLKTLTDARLVTTEQDSAEVAHEALIREWGTLRKWLDEDRESLRLHRHLTESAQEWQRRGREASELYRGARLKQLQDWVKEHGEQLSPLEREFVKASRNVKKRERILWDAIAIAGVALLLLVIFMPAGIINRLIYLPENIMPEDDWVTIPAGDFQMGSDNGAEDEKPVHNVYVDEFQIGKYEVTNKQFNQCIRAGVCKGTILTGKLDHPVVNVTWFQAEDYCGWAGGRLPTEAEWEKAASWDDKTKTKNTYPWGKTIDCSYANYYGKNDGNSYCVGDTTPVGSYESGKSLYGLYDMAGNVWEWVNDWYQSDYYATLGDKTSNPMGPSNGNGRVLRGGSWLISDSNVRSAYRSRYIPTYTRQQLRFSLCPLTMIVLKN